MAPLLRAATPADAPDLARLVDLAGEGLPRHLWARMAPAGADLWAFGAARAARDEGAFSWRNARIALLDGRVAGAAVSYTVPDAPEPLDGLPPLVRPLQELENLAPGTRYLNVLATYPGFRRRGVAAALLADFTARATPRGSAIIVADRNLPALGLYLAHGFREVARRPIVHEDWQCESRDWILLLRGAGLAMPPGTR